MDQRVSQPQLWQMEYLQLLQLLYNPHHLHLHQLLQFLMQHLLQLLLLHLPLSQQLHLRLHQLQLQPLLR